MIRAKTGNPINSFRPANATENQQTRLVSFMALPMFRFTIRDVLWLTVVVGLGVGWFVDSSAREAEQARIWREAMEAREEMQKAADARGYRFVGGSGGLTLQPKNPPPFPHPQIRTLPTAALNDP